MSTNLLVLVCMVTSGTLFGLWPILKEYSGIGGLSPMLLVSGVSLLVMVVTLVLRAEALVPNALSVRSSTFLVASGLCVGFGLVVFLEGLRIATAGSVHNMHVPFTIMIMVQVAVPIVFQIVLNWSEMNMVNVLGLIGTPAVIFALQYR